MLARRCRRLPSSTTGAASVSNRRSTRSLLLGAGREDRELVAAEAGDGVLAAQRVAQALAADLQQLVAGRVAERVVDLLEVVEVDEGDDGGLAGGQRLGDALLEQRAVRESGQRVLEREPAQVAVALAAAAGAVEQREQRGQADHHQRHHDDRADPGHPVAAVGELVVAVGGGAQAVADAVEVDVAVDRRRRARSRASASARTPPRSAADTSANRRRTGVRALAAAAHEALELGRACRRSSEPSSAWDRSGTRRLALASDSSASTRLALDSSSTRIS